MFILLKNGEVKNAIINLLPYYENTGWLLLCVDNKIIDIEETKRLKIIADNTVKLEYCNIIKKMQEARKHNCKFLNLTFKNSISEVAQRKRTKTPTTFLSR
jgi:hypothetical protein